MKIIKHFLLFGAVIFSINFLFAADEVSMRPWRGTSNEFGLHLDDPILKAIVLVGNEKDFSKVKKNEIKGVVVYNLDIPSGEGNLKAVLKPYLHSTPLRKESIDKIKHTIIEYFQDKGRPIVAVYTPSQDISSGILKFVVLEARLGKVYCTGNKWFKSKELIGDIRIKKGDVIRSEVLTKDLYWLNRNPFRTVQAIYTPGVKEGTTDIELLVSDRIPFRLYTGGDNTGTDITDEYRLFGGLNVGSIFGSNKTFSYQFITSPHYKQFYAHTAHFTWPLFWRHILVVYGGYSHVNDYYEIVEAEEKFHIKGISKQVSVRYEIPFGARGVLLQEVALGFDFKRTNNTLEYGGLPLEGKYVNLSQFMASYNLGWRTKRLTLSFHIEGFVSPGRMFSDQENLDFQTLRPNARNQYFYTRASGSLLWEIFYGFHIDNYLRGQYATENLLPSEEYGLGGYDTVRGYQERIVNVDNTFIYNLEFKTPKVQPLKWQTNGRMEDSLEFLAFLDLAWGDKHKPIEAEVNDRFLLGVGPGIRYSIIPYLTFRCDWGFRLRDLSKTGLEMPHNRGHFSIILGF